MTVDLSTVQKGDTVLIEAEVVEIDVGSGRNVLVDLVFDREWISSKLIKEVIKKPFDWKDVKPGDVFVTNGSGRKFIYCHSFPSGKSAWFFPGSYKKQPVLCELDNLTRAPEFDLGVE